MTRGVIGNLIQSIQRKKRRFNFHFEIQDQVESRVREGKKSSCLSGLLDTDGYEILAKLKILLNFISIFAR